MKIQKRVCPNPQKLKDAINSVKSGVSYSNASLLFNIPKATIHSHIKNPKMRKRTGPQDLLTEVENTLLIEWVIKCGKRGSPSRKKDIIDSAYQLLQRRTNYIAKRPGPSWFYAFKKRNAMAFRKPECISKSSASINQKDIESWFSRIFKYITGQDEVGDIDYSDALNDPARCYNADETFLMLNPSKGPVVVPRGTKNVFEIKDGSEKEGVTCMACFSADGGIVMPQLVYPYERIPAIIRSNFPTTLHLSCSKSGWMNTDLFIEFITEVFHPHILEKHGENVPVILFIDGHASHLSIEAGAICDDLNILLIQLYPNSTFLIQPADVACFKSLKSFWYKEVIWYRGNNFTKAVSKADVGDLLNKSMNQVTPQTIMNGFRASGLVPWDPSNVDFSKCLGKNFNSSNQEVSEENPVNSEENPVNSERNTSRKTTSMDLESFTKLAGKKKIDELMSNDQPFDLLSDDRKTLQLIYNHLAGRSTNSEELLIEDNAESSYSNYLPEELINDDEPLINHFNVTTHSNVIEKQIDELINVDESMIDLYESRYTNYTPEELINHMNNITTHSSDSDLSIDPQEFLFTNNAESRYLNYSPEKINNDNVIDEPMYDPIVEPIDEPIDEPMYDPIVEPMYEPIVELIVEPIDELIDEPSAEHSVTIDDRSIYEGALFEPPIPQRLNKRKLKVKPDYILSSKRELERKIKARDEKEAAEQSKKERVLLRDQNKKMKIEEKILNVEMKAVAATAKLKKKADEIAAKLQKKALSAAVAAAEELKNNKRRTRSHK